MDIHFLGTSASPSMPLPFCTCAACQIARQAGGKNLRRRSALLIDDRVLIDLGPDVVSAAFHQGRSLAGLRLCLQTHPHEDHFDPELIISRHPEYGTQIAAPLIVAGSRGTLAGMDALVGRRCGYGSLFDPAVRQALALQIEPLAPFQPRILDGYQVLGYPANHAPGTEALLFSVARAGRAVLYATDTAAWFDTVWDDLRTRGICYDLVILDHTYGPGYETTDHLAAADFARHVEMLNEEQVLQERGRIYATHLSHEGIREHDELAAYARSRGYEVAYDGLTIQLD